MSAKASDEEDQYNKTVSRNESWKHNAIAGSNAQDVESFILGGLVTSP